MEQAKIQSLSIALKSEMENKIGQIANIERFLKLADKYSDLQELVLFL